MTCDGKHCRECLDDPHPTDLDPGADVDKPRRDSYVICYHSVCSYSTQLSADFVPLCFSHLGEDLAPAFTWLATRFNELERRCTGTSAREKIIGPSFPEPISRK
jgi:hypothetical protein